jgi:hypothetical protein
MQPAIERFFNSHFRRLLAIAVTTGAGACSDNPQFVVRPGEIPGPGSVQIPSTFRVGIPDSVVVTTVGNGCVSFAGTRSSIQGGAQVVEPLDSERVGVVCTDIGKTFRHTAILTLSSPGAVVVRVTGWNDQRSPITIERTATVQ